MKIIISTSFFYHSDKSVRVQGLIDFINLLREYGVSDLTLDQLYPQAQMIYFVDFYNTQIDNGGILQFFTNAQFDIGIMGHVLNGLELIGAIENKRLFQKVLETLFHNPSIMTYWRQYGRFQKEVYTLFDEVFNYEFFQLNDSETTSEANELIVDLSYDYLEKIDGLQILPDEDCEEAFTQLLASLPTNNAPTSDENSRHDFVVEAFCEKFALPLSPITMIDYGTDIVGDEEAEKNEQAGIFFYYFTTSEQTDAYYYIVDDGDNMTLFDGTTKTPIGTMTNAELQEWFQ
ncbi:MAG: DUF4375 domain-containing protein [Gammaproteobacteria bacterium]